MDEPRTLTVIIRITVIIIVGLVIPQALGFWGYCWARKKKKILKALTLLIAPLTFFLIANIFWWQEVRAIERAGHYVCGAFGAMVVFITGYGTLINFALGVIIFFIIIFDWNKLNRRIE